VNADGCVAPATICWSSSGTSGNWENPAAWIIPGNAPANRLPTATDDVNLPLSVSVFYYITVSSVQTVHSIFIGNGAVVQCTTSCVLTVLTHTPVSTFDSDCGILNIAGTFNNHAAYVDACEEAINILAGGAFVNHNSVDFTTYGGSLTNNGVFIEKCGAQVVGGLSLVTGNVATETPCPTQVSGASFSSELGGFTSLSAQPVSSISTPPPSGVTFPDGVFSFTLALATGATITVVITLPTPFPSGPFTYYKFHAGSWQQVPASKVTLDATRTIITLTLTDGATPDDADVSANGVIVDPGGPAITGPTSQPAVHPLNVGGAMLPVNLAQVLGPWVAAMLALAVIVVETLVIRRKKNHKP